MTDSLRFSAARDADQRRSNLLQLARERGKLDVAQIVALADVSGETIRRDLRMLEAQGLIRRSYGKVFPVESGAFESSLETRRDISPEEKSRIAAAVVARIGEARTLFIDEGFNSQLIAEKLPDDHHFTVVTASLPIATILAPRVNIQLVMLGGRVRGSTLGVVDGWAVEMLHRLNLDLAIVGANGISVDKGVTTPDPAVAAVKRAAMDAATRRIWYGAHHKFHRTTFVTFGALDEFETIITGHELPANHANRFIVAGARIIRV